MEQSSAPEVTPAEDSPQERKRPDVERVYSNDHIAVSWEPKHCIHVPNLGSEGAISWP
jgi:hypothetical protein